MNKNGLMYSWPVIRKSLACLGLVLVAMKATGGSGFLIVPIIALMALARRDGLKLLFWLMVTVAALCSNHFLAPKNFLFVVAQRGMMVSLGVLMTLMLFGQRKSGYLTPTLSLVPYLLYMIIPSMTGFCPPVSYLKLFLFIVIFFAYFSSVNMAISDGRSNLVVLRSMFLAIAIYVILGSVAVIPFPQISIMSSTFLKDANLADLPSLFQGVTTHSQAMGPMVSTLSIFVFADLLFSIRRPDKLYLLLLLAAPVLVYKTQSRTGMGAYAIGMAFVAFLFMRERTIKGAWKSKVFTGLTACFIGVMMLALLSGGIGKQVEKILLKGAHEQAALTFENVTSSRQNLINESMENFHKRPMFGNGFQVSRDMIGRDTGSLRSILTAPIEKGVWIFAVLEEGGVVGMILFVFFIFTCLTTLVKRKAYVGASVLFTFIVCNLGEFGFFAMSYVGGFSWAFIFVGLGVDALRNRMLTRSGPPNAVLAPQW